MENNEPGTSNDIEKTMEGKLNISYILTLFVFQYSFNYVNI